MDESMFRFLARQAGFAETGFSSAADFKAQQRLVKSQPPLQSAGSFAFFRSRMIPGPRALPCCCGPMRKKPCRAGDACLWTATMPLQTPPIMPRGSLKSRFSRRAVLRARMPRIPAREARCARGWGFAGEKRPAHHPCDLAHASSSS